MRKKLSTGAESIWAALRNQRGLVDLQSVMVGVIISAIVAGTAMVSVVGVTRMLDDDTARTKAITLHTAMETFYTNNDKYPSQSVPSSTPEADKKRVIAESIIQQLIDKDYLPASYKKDLIEEQNLCVVLTDPNSLYPQGFKAATKSSTGRYFVVDSQSGEAKRINEKNQTCF